MFRTASGIPDTSLRVAEVKGLFKAALKAAFPGAGCRTTLPPCQMSEQKTDAEQEAPNGDGQLPLDPNRVGEVIKRLRNHQKMSLRQLADGTGLSTSFLSSVERGENDITVGRLARVAEFFGHDIGSLLGYSSRRARPQIIGAAQRIAVPRGKGIEYWAYPLPGLEMELFLMRFEPGSRFDTDSSHEGIDAAIVLESSLMLRVAGKDYPLQEGETAVWSAAYPHSLRNDSDRAALAVGFGDLVYW
jgi:transcriptional regulator with XRE-family HTH domain